MRYLLFFIVVLFSVASCQNRQTLIDDLNEAKADTNQYKFETKGFDGQGRNLIYLLDPTCSVCIGDYVAFLMSLGCSDCKYDSLFTIISNGHHLIKVEYYLERDSVFRPETERYIIDDEGTLTDYYYSISNSNTILLFDGGKLVFTSSVQAYRYMPEVGLMREKNN